MREAKIHHYIPQSYLRNFATERKGEHYVYVRFQGEKFHETNIKNICSEQYFYSIPGASEETKNIVEKYYANHIDVLFPEITDIITDDDIKEIDSSTRVKIISAFLSLYFRTPKFLEWHTKHLLRAIELLKAWKLGSTERHTIDFLGQGIDIRNVNLEELEDEVLNKRKLIFLEQHFKIFNAFVDYKKNDGMGIIKTVDDNEFITCDNPVIIRSYGGETSENLFDPSNLVNVPINSKYLLFIHPKEDVQMKDTLTRISGQLTNVLVTNLEVERNSERWIIGSEASVNKHIQDQEHYNQRTPENEKMVTDLQKKSFLAFDLYQIMQKNHGEISQELIDKLKELSQHELLKDDPNIKRFVATVKSKGFSI